MKNKIILFIFIITILFISSCTIDYNKKSSNFVIVDNPEYNKITNQIKKSLIGKYSVKQSIVRISNEDIYEYFELKKDGTISLRLSSGGDIITYNSKDIKVYSCYYQTDQEDKSEGTLRIVLSFNLISGSDYFPDGLSMSFWSTDNENVFYGITNGAYTNVEDGETVEFVKE